MQSQSGAEEGVGVEATVAASKSHWQPCKSGAQTLQLRPKSPQQPQMAQSRPSSSCGQIMVYGVSRKQDPSRGTDVT